MDRLKIYDDIDKLCEGFSVYVLEQIRETDFYICLSGGSTPKAIFKYWSEKYRTKIPWSRIIFFWGDERCVMPDDEDSNYGMTKQYLLENIEIPETNIFRIKGEHNPDEEVKRYSQLLQEEVPSQHGIPQFDLVILGLGDDGHTASIFPHELELWDSPDNCVKAQHPDKDQTRISITGKVINNAKEVVFLVTGANKAEVVQNIALRKKIHTSTFPAARVDPNSENLTWFLDPGAASKL